MSSSINFSNIKSNIANFFQTKFDTFIQKINDCIAPVKNIAEKVKLSCTNTNNSRNFLALSDAEQNDFVLSGDYTMTGELDVGSKVSFTNNKTNKVHHFHITPIKAEEDNDTYRSAVANVNNYVNSSGCIDLGQYYDALDEMVNENF